MFDVLDRRSGSRDVCLGLLELRAVVVVDELDEQLAGLDRLEILHGQLADIGWDLGGQRRGVGLEIGIVRGLPYGRPHPPVPFARHEDDEPAYGEKYEKPDGGAEPAECSGRPCRSQRRASGRRIACAPHTPAWGGALIVQCFSRVARAARGMLIAMCSVDSPDSRLR